ncbi:MAG: hypothetical protein LUF30_10840 [Lachnospiraceae bacterium]|nr:hypothetical protein [Lachnospiraceae bacterium]
MKRVISRSGGNWIHFLIAIVLVACCIPVDSIDVFWNVLRSVNTTLDVQYFFLNSITYGGIFGGYFISVLAALPCADIFCREYEDGIWRYLVARAGTKSYVCRKICKVFLSGGLVSCCGCGLAVAVLCRWLPLFSQTRLVEVEFLPFSGFLQERPILYFGIMLYLMFLNGGFWATASLCFSVYVPIRYLVYLFPFVASFLLTRVNALLQIPVQWRLNFLLHGRMGPASGTVYLTVVTGEVVLLVFFGFILFFRKLRWRISNE